MNVWQRRQSLPLEQLPQSELQSELHSKLRDSQQLSLLKLQSEKPEHSDSDLQLDLPLPQSEQSDPKLQELQLPLKPLPVFLPPPQQPRVVSSPLAMAANGESSSAKYKNDLMSCFI
jgi:hypothetical protein